MDFIMVTGFLGAGKTTAVKRLIGLFPQKRILVLVNEFGREGIDQELLRPLGAGLAQISGGSVFCSCRLDQFERALDQAILSGPDLVILEASGLSDPTSIEGILGQERYSSIRYLGGICIVDAANFHKVLSTVRVCRAQLETSLVVVINKADLVSAQRLEELRAQVRELAPKAAVFWASFGEMDEAWLGEMRITGTHSKIHQNKEPGLQDRTIRFKQIGLEELRRFLFMVAPRSHRVKGFVRCEEGQMFVDCVGESISITPVDQENGLPSAVELLSGGLGAGMEDAVDEALQSLEGRAYEGSFGVGALKAGGTKRKRR